MEGKNIDSPSPKKNNATSYSFMLIPVWCPHCRTSLGDKIEAWEAMRPKDRHDTHNLQGVSSQAILEALGLTNMCCKKVMLTTNVLIHTLNQYKRPQIHVRSDL